jgi:hypothetical protein
MLNDSLITIKDKKFLSLGLESGLFYAYLNVLFASFYFFSQRTEVVSKMSAMGSVAGGGDLWVQTHVLFSQLKSISVCVMRAF